MKNFADTIITNKTHCYFVSPSFGDAASSTGELLSYLSGKVGVTVFNIFTKQGDSKLTFSTKRFLKHSGNTNSEALYTLNKQEDADALGLLSATIYNLGFVDALWRKKKNPPFIGKYIPEFESMYPTYLHIMSGVIVKEDNQLYKDLLISLRAMVKNNTENVKVFCPIGFATHVDYLLVRDACLEVFGDNCVFYSLPVEDIQDKEKNAFLRKNNLTPLQFTFSSEIKSKILKKYESKSKQFFSDESLVFRPEMYYIHTETEARTLDVKVYKKLDTSIFHDWQYLWNTSSLKNFFNTPLWFQACVKTFRYKESLLLACYDGKKLVGILPIVLTEKYGVPTYATPGNQYYDNSSLLLEINDSHVLTALLKKLSEIGNFYLSEIGQGLANMSIISIPEVRIVKGSICPYLLLDPDPYRFITKKNKQRLAKKFKDAEGKSSYKIYNEHAQEQLRTLLTIDAESSKKTAFKDTFADPLLAELLTNIHELDDKALVVAILFYEEEPISYNYGFVYDKTYIGSGTAFKETWRHLAPGRVLAYSLLPELMKIGVTMLDFSRGYTQYKRDFTPYAYHQYTLFYSSNLLVMKRWQTLESVKAFLEKHYLLFEFIRKTKKMMMK